MSRYEIGKTVCEKVSAADYQWPSCDFFYGDTLLVFGYEKLMGGSIRWAAERCVFGMGWEIFLNHFQKKLILFTDSLCRMLDEMMDSAARTKIDYHVEILLARISHRLERLYNVMQKDRNTVAKENADLQSLLTDTSYQTKPPIANLKMLNETMLTHPISEEQRKEFLQATGSQLDKLDFFILAMVKTFR